MKFPIKKYYTVNEYDKNYFKLLNELSESINFKKLDKIIKIIKKNYSSKFNKLFVCGNGGSAALANHFACDHQKILFETKKIKPEIISLSSNTALITAIANDNSYDQIFVDQLKQTGNKKDILFTISSSGNSKNVVNALKYANQNGLITISLTGFNGGVSKKISKHNVHVDCSNYGIVEAVHHSIMNIISQFIKSNLIDKKKIANTIF